jgi:uncharacterized SAM-binding protein YcdF (DUF218 family)
VHLRFGCLPGIDAPDAIGGTADAARSHCVAALDTGVPDCDVKRSLLFLLVASVLAALGLTYAVAQAGYWLEAPGRPPMAADALIILGGDNGDRALRGLALYRAGFAPIIVLTGLEHGKATPPARLTWRAEYLVARGVPKSALRFEIESRNSYEEAANVLALMRKQGWRRVIAVSDPPHMRRLNWTWERVFNGSGMQFVLVASAAEWWRPGKWWRDEQSGAFVITEYIKLVYYVIKR